MPPSAALGPFWKQFRHIGRLQECYSEALNTKTIRFDYANKRYEWGCYKDALKKYLQKLDQELLRAVGELNWNLSIDWDGKVVSVFQHLLWMVAQRDSSSRAMDRLCPAYGQEAAAELESVGSIAESNGFGLR